ncbi:MAG: acetylglutamate kinase [Clostridiales bacterium]|jgi:acetylglutamate kinase|nr:acetylglutamate kinase [Clostridiales bacterium]
MGDLSVFTMNEYIGKAKVLIEALPYIQEFRGITVVIKYGGAALVNEEIKNTLIQDIALMKYVGFKPVVVHGGGPEINRMLDKLGIKSEFVNGLRVTDAASMEVVEMVLAGKVNKKITTEITMQGTPAVGLSGKDAGLLKVKKLKPGGEDIGFVGEVTEVDNKIIKTLIDNDFIPVISPIGIDENGETYNINADYAAVAIAGALKAEKLVFLTDVSGLLSDRNDADSVITRIEASRIRELLADGTISGGMIPKIQCCMAGVEAGVAHVHILDGRVEHALILEIFTKEGIGTMIYS